MATATTGSSSATAAAAAAGGGAPARPQSASLSPHRISLATVREHSPGAMGDGDGDTYGGERSDQDPKDDDDDEPKRVLRPAAATAGGGSGTGRIERYSIAGFPEAGIFE